MKKLFSLLVCVMFGVLLLTGCGQDYEYYNAEDGEDVLTIVTSPDYAPYEFVKDPNVTNSYTKYGGADIEVMKYIATELGMKLKITEADFSVCPTDVNSGKADLSISGFSWTPTRAENYELSESYFNEGDGNQEVMINVADAEKFTSFADINKSDVKVGCQAGSLQEEYVDAYLPNCDKQSFDNIDQAIIYLKNGSFDCVVLSEFTIDVRTEIDDTFCSMGVTFNEEFSLSVPGMVVLAKKGNTELIDKVNVAVEKMIENNLYSQWMEEATTEASNLGLDD